MNLYLRLLWLLLGGRSSGSGRAPLAPSRLRMRVLPTDIDPFGHVNNGRYLSLMDLGRLHLVMRSGLLAVMRRRRWQAAASAVEIRFRRPLKLWQRYTLVTEIADWDPDWFLFEQRFESAGKVCARALVQAQFRHRRRRVGTAQVLEAAGAQGLVAPAGGRLVGSLATSVPADD